MPEENLYDGSGHPAAYIAQDGASIFTWAGTAVCHLRDDRLFGWNGKHLGWMVDGIVYDLDGRRVGYTRSRVPVVPSVPSVKSVRSVPSVKSVPEVPRIRPALSTARSSHDLEDFLQAGTA